MTTIVAILILSLVSVSNVTPTQASGVTTLIDFVSGGAEFDNDVAGSAAGPFDGATLTTRNLVGTTHLVDTASGLRKANRYYWVPGDSWTFDWDRDTSLHGFSMEIYNNIQVSLQSDDWIGLSVTPGHSSVTFNSTTGTITMVNRGITYDPFDLNDLTSGDDILVVRAGTDVTFHYNGSIATSEIRSMSWNMNPDISESVQDLVDAATAGDTITLDPAVSYDPTFNLNKSVTLDLNGATIGAGASPMSISAPNVVVKNGTLDGGGAAVDAISVAAGGDNATLQDLIITGFADGVSVDASVTSFKLVDTHIHNNSGHGVNIASGVALNGVVTIEGNLFEDNGGNGIQNDGTTANLPAQYNNWNDMAGPAGTNGDGVGGSVDASNPTYAKFLVDVIPATVASSHSVLEDDQFVVNVDVDAAGLYAVEYQLSYDDTLLRLDSTANGTVHGTGACSVNTATSGVVDVYCYRLNPDADVNAAASVISALTFTADLSGIGDDEDGNWTNLFDLNHVSAELRAGARNGINIFVDTADVEDNDDGQIIITGIGQFAGFVDVQGRTDDSGVSLTVHDDAAGTTQMATATSNSDGSYLTAYESTHKLAIGTEYHITVDAPLALSTAVTAATLNDRPNTNLSMITLLGGDATDDETISLADATCIATDFGSSASTCATGSSDVNGDGVINIVDLVLMGGNFGSSGSAWAP